MTAPPTTTLFFFFFLIDHILKQGIAAECKMSPTCGMRQTKRKRLGNGSSLRRGRLTAHSGLFAARHQSSAARFRLQESGGILMTQAQNCSIGGLLLYSLHQPSSSYVCVCVWVCVCVSLRAPPVAGNTHWAESISASICSCRAAGTLH